jgi:hypothetical protein
LLLVVGDLFYLQWDRLWSGVRAMMGLAHTGAVHVKNIIQNKQDVIVDDEGVADIGERRKWWKCLEGRERRVQETVDW